MVFTECIYSIERDCIGESGTNEFVKELVRIRYYKLFSGLRFEIRKRRLVISDIYGI